MNVFRGRGVTDNPRARSRHDLAAQDDPARMVQHVGMRYRILVEDDQVSGGAVGQPGQAEPGPGGPAGRAHRGRRGAGPR